MRVIIGLLSFFCFFNIFFAAKRSFFVTIQIVKPSLLAIVWRLNVEFVYCCWFAVCIWLIYR